MYTNERIDDQDRSTSAAAVVRWYTGAVCYLLPAAMAEHSVRQFIGAHVVLRFTSIKSTGKRFMYNEDGRPQVLFNSPNLLALPQNE